MHTQHYDYSNNGCECSHFPHTGQKCNSCCNRPTLYKPMNSKSYTSINHHGVGCECGCKSHAGKNYAGQNYAGQNYAGQNYAGKNYAGQSYTNKSNVGYKCPECHKCGEYECPSHNLTAISIPVETNEMSPLCDHTCVEHNWNFECTLKDSCCRQDGTNDNGAVSFSNLDLSAGTTSGVGVKNLGRYLIVRAGDGKAVDIGTINFNETGFAVSLWIRTDNLNQLESRLFSKTGAIEGQSHDLESHVVSAALTGNGGLQFRLKLGNDPLTGTTEWETGSDVLTSDTWHHVVFWYDGCTVKIFIDAVEHELSESAEGTPFMKGRPVFQGNQPVALASQPTNDGDNVGWRRFEGNLDQVVIWNYAIGNDVITALYNGSEGSTVAPEVSSISSATFGCYRVQLKQWNINLCLETCFLEADLCTLFNQCGNVALLVTNHGKCRTVIVPETNLNGWSGSLETLDSKLIEDGEKRSYTIRLGLDLNHCPVYLGPCDQVDFVINRGNFIKTPVPNFVITGKPH